MFCEDNNELIPRVLLAGADQFRMYDSSPHSIRSLGLLKKAFIKVSSQHHYDEILNGAFSRPQSLLQKIESIKGTELLILYYFGHQMNRRDGRVLLAHPASNPRKTSTHISMEDLVTAYGPSRTRKLLAIIDSDGLRENQVAIQYFENALFIFRRLKNSKTTWTNGGDMFTGSLAEAIVEMYRSLPSITFRQIFDVVAYRLGSRDLTKIVFLRGDQKIIDECLFSRNKTSGLWYSERGNLESLNRGSREDGIQALASGMQNEEERDEAIAILDFLAATDRTMEVRRAAKGLKALTSPPTIEIPSSERIDINPKLVLPSWIKIPAGTFLMGSDPSHDKDALPEEMAQHKITLPDYWIAQKPVTRREWEHFLEASLDISDIDERRWGHEELDLPVTEVSWYEARAYASWLTSLYRSQTLIRPDEEIRIPTEAEWEKAARGVEGLIYPWGNEFERNRCNCRPEEIGHIVPSGNYSPQGDSPFGVADMSGNVWEWTLSLWGQGGHKPEFSYPYDHQDGREDHSAGPEIRRVIRGGAFYYFDYCVRVATRNVMYPYTKHSGGGFRLVKVQVPRWRTGASQ